MSATQNSTPVPIKTQEFPFPYAKAAFALIGLLTLFRLWYCQTFELVADEAYYRLWSQHLDWSYFSKGPGVATIMAAGRFLLGDGEFGIRFFAVMFSGGIGILFFQLGKMLFSERVGFWAVVTAACVPMFSVGSVLMTIDPISVFFWMAASCTFWKAQKSPHLTWWILTGFLVGLGMLGKYTNGVQLLCFAFFCLFSRTHRSLLMTSRFWLMVVVTGLCLTPVVFWNMKNDWITVEHLMHRGGLDKGTWAFNPGELFQFITMQAVVLSPFIFVGLIMAIVAVFRDSRQVAMPASFCYLLALFIPLVALYLALSTKEAGEANWTVLSHTSGLVLMVAVWLKWIDGSVLMKRCAIGGLIISFCMVAFLHVASTRTVGFKPIDKLFDRTRGAKDLSYQVAQMQKEYGASFIIANKYGYASLLSYYHPEQPQTYLPNAQGIQNQFSFWQDYSDGFWAESALFVSDSDELPEQLKREFREVRFIKEAWSHFGDRKIRKFNIYLCSDFGGREEKLLMPEPRIKLKGKKK
ncbi:MAG: glycosyltransferase family 39 protein [Blastochloris sp.]|nr:glycosyltransferase family 39 protein [Blastochloris sp.]